jgi:hypothetical protein
VWSEGIVLHSPPFDEYLGLPEGIEDLSIEQFVSEFPVEAFAVAVFPWAARFDIQGPYPRVFQPLANSLGGEFRAVIRPDMFRRTVGHKEIREALEDVIGFEVSVYHNGEALSTEFVDDRQYLNRTAVASAVCHEIIGPDMMTMGGPEPDTRPIIEPRTSSLGLLLGNFQPLLTPDAFHPLVIDPPAGSSEQGCNPAINVASIPLGKPNNLLSKSLFGMFAPGYEPLGRPGLGDYPASTPLRYSQLSLQVEDTSSTTLGA